MMILLFNRENKTRQVDVPDFNIVEFGDVISENYYSLSYRGEKIGYTSTIKKNIPRGYLYQEASFYRLPVGGVVQEITGEGLMAVDDSLRTRNFTFTFSGGGYETTVNAVVRDSMLLAEVITPGNSESMQIELNGPFYTSSIIPEFVAMQDFKRGSYELPTFDPMSLSSRNYKIIINGKDIIKRFGDRTVYDITIKYGAMRGKMYVDTSATLLMETTPEGFMSVKEDKEKALALDYDNKGSNDLLEDFSIMMAGEEIEKPREAIELKIKIENLTDEFFQLDDFNQRWNPENKILTIKSDGFANDSSTWTDSDTSETFDIQCNDRRIISRAEKITQNSSGQLEKLLAINSYLFENIDKQYAASIPSAVDVLRKMEGDCNEHTILFVALSRSIGIPSRVNVGLLYMNGMFYYHAWPQAFAEGRWRTFDPTFNQYPADAAHIKLISGGLDMMIGLLRVGDARLELESVKYE